MLRTRAAEMMKKLDVKPDQKKGAKLLDAKNQSG